MKSIATRLATLYAVMLGVIVLLVVVVSSVALVYKLSALTGDILIAKHDEARILVDQYRMEGKSLADVAPQLVNDLSGIGLRVAVFDQHGKYLAGDRDLHPRIIRELAARPQMVPPGTVARVEVKGGFGLQSIFGAPPSKRALYTLTFSSMDGGPPPGPPSGSGSPRQEALPPPADIAGVRFGGPQSTNTPERLLMRDLLMRGPGPRGEPLGVAMVSGGFVAFSPSLGLIWVALVPYWRIIGVLAVVALVLAWFIGRYFSRQALAPLSDVSDALRALAQGQYEQRRFVLAGTDEMLTLTSAYNDAAANVAAAMEERRTTEERMRRFVSDAGHELRTPLTVIAGYIDVLRRGAVEEPKVARQILQTMAIEKEHMRQLIDRLMRLARLDSDEPPKMESIDLSEFLREQVEAVRRLDAQRTVDYHVDATLRVLADRAELGDAVWNVIENALKYAPEAPVHVRGYRSNGTAHIAITDEGPGMTESERLHAFERFYRGDVRGETTGSGLGLAIAKRAIQRAGGDIRIDTALGSGTTVSIALPALS